MQILTYLPNGQSDSTHSELKCTKWVLFFEESTTVNS